jgi:hypothetical protein
MNQEARNITRLFKELRQEPRTYFPPVGQKLIVPVTNGVYVIYSPRGDVLHVGRTIRGKRGIWQRLNNHLHGSSSFTKKHFGGSGLKLRGTHTFSFLEISDARTRALVEALAIGTLCPIHIGLGESLV